MGDPLVEKRMKEFEADCDTAKLFGAIVVMALPIPFFGLIGILLLRDGYIVSGLQCLGVTIAYTFFIYVLVFKWDMIGDHARHWEKKMQPFVKRSEAFAWQQADDHEHIYR